MSDTQDKINTLIVDLDTHIDGSELEVFMTDFIDITNQMGSENGSSPVGGTIMLMGTLELAADRKGESSARYLLQNFRHLLEAKDEELLEGLSTVDLPHNVILKEVENLGIYDIIENKLYTCGESPRKLIIQGEFLNIEHLETEDGRCIWMLHFIKEISPDSMRLFSRDLQRLNENISLGNIKKPTRIIATPNPTLAETIRREVDKKKNIQNPTVFRKVVSTFRKIFTQKQFSKEMVMSTYDVDVDGFLNAGIVEN